MEKGFNDEELADIMSEIESLEQEFVQDVEEQPVQSQPVAEQQEESEEVGESTENVEQPQASQPEEQEDESEEVDDAFEEEVHAQSEEVQEDKVQPIEEHKEIISEDEVHVHASIQQEQEPVDGEMNEVLDELSQMPVSDVTPTHSKQDDNVHHFKGGEKVSEKKNQTAMSFHVEGDMKLELSFHIADQFIGVNITDEGLVVGLEGGAKFTIPVQPQGQNKKAA